MACTRATWAGALIVLALIMVAGMDLLRLSTFHCQATAAAGKRCRGRCRATGP